MQEIEDLIVLESKLKEYERFHQLELYKPYEKQKEFHHAKGKGTNKCASQRALMAANRVGKTHSAGFEIGIHATGQYPKWWKGHRFHRPVDIVVAGVSNDLTRDIVQKELLGKPDNAAAKGTGAIPKDCIKDMTRKPGVPQAYQSVLVRHVSGGASTIRFMAYEQDWKKFQGISFDIGWMDEEPPIEVYSQFLRATTDRPTSILLLTFTPEEGITDVVDGFLNDLKPGQSLTTMTWDDAPHLTEEKKAQILAALPPHQREMRSKGIPMMGSGLVFPIREEDIVIKPVPIQDHWAQIIGVDFGVEHPFAAARLAWDRDADIVYLTHEYREAGKTPPTHASAIRGWGDWIPIMWPHDGIIRDKGSGIPLAEQYRHCGLKMHWEKFSNPPGPGQKEGQGGQGVEAGLFAMLERMESGRFKVFNTCTGWLEERRMYHRKQGALVKVRDDMISASRYAHQMLRFAKTKNYQYGGKLEYKDDRAIV